MTDIVHHAGDFTAEALRLDPKYAQLRRRAGLSRVTMPYGGDAWLATRYEDVRQLLADPRFSRQAAVGTAAPRIVPVDQQGGSLLGMDPPEHSRLRRLVAKAFTVRRVNDLRPRVRQLVDGLLDEMAAAGPPADLTTALAWPLPITVICELLGVPVEDHGRFRQWTDALVALSVDDLSTIEAARDSLDAYLADLMAQRRERPADDLFSALVAARDEGDRLTEEELVAFGVTLLVAGHETTADQIGNFAFTLLSERRHWESLVADPGLVPTAVEELLRHTPLEATVGFFARIATEDVELGGQIVRAGEAVIGQLAAANRDETVFTDPDTLDLTRRANAHLAFGHGVHHCVGAPLARMELQVALDSLVRRFPGLRLAIDPETADWRRNRNMRALNALPVTW